MVLYNADYPNDIRSFFKECGEGLYRKETKTKTLARWVECELEIKTLNYINTHLGFNKNLFRQFSNEDLDHFLPDIIHMSSRSS